MLSSTLFSSNQYLTKSPSDNVGYPTEFKSWYDISGVSNDYKYISNFNVLELEDATSQLDNNLIGNQLIFNKLNTYNTGSSIYSTITSEFINISQSLNDGAGGVHNNTHLQFAARGTTHPYSGSFTGFNPTYKVEITSGSTTFFSKVYKDVYACEHDWAVFDIPVSDVLRKNATTTSETDIHEGFKVSVGFVYGSSTGSINGAAGTNGGLGIALTEMRLVEPARIASLDTQTVHFKDTYLTWDGTNNTAHKGNIIPLVKSTTTAGDVYGNAFATSSWGLGNPTQKWDEIYLNLKEENIVSEILGPVTASNKFVRVNTATGKLSFTSASVGSGGGSGTYSLPLGSSSTRGGFKIGYSENGKNYPVEISSEKMYVNVPWADTNTNTQLSDAQVRSKFSAGENVSISAAGVISSTDTNTDTNTTYTADGNYGMTLNGTAFRLEDDRRRNSTGTDIYSGNTHDYTFYDASVGIRWYTAGSEEMRLLDNGTLHVDGDVVAYSTTVSDERLKDNVFTIKSALDKVSKLRGVEYIWNAGSRKGQSDIGFIAQEVENIIPQIVREHTMPLIEGGEDTLYKTVDYEKVTALLIEAVKEQQITISKLEKRVESLEGGYNN